MPIFITVKPPATIKLTRHYPFSIINFPFAMNITLFGGSFNPPHLGHQIVLAQAFELIPHLDQIWLLPEYQHSFAKNTHLAPVKHRLAMVKLFENLSTNRRIKLQTCCLDQKMSGNTIEHITCLKAK